MEQHLLKQSDRQLSLWDPGARDGNPGCGRRRRGYNLPSAVDTQHHLVVAREVTGLGGERAQLDGMALPAQKAKGELNQKV